MKKIDKNEKDKFKEDLIADVKADFENRRKARVENERQWELNMNFISGNQYCGINARGDLEDKDRDFFWQEREVFNHVAPVIESRLARFSRVSPLFSVRPKTDDDKDVNGAAKPSKKLPYGAKPAERAFIKSSGITAAATPWAKRTGKRFSRAT